MNLYFITEKSKIFYGRKTTAKNRTLDLYSSRRILLREYYTFIEYTFEIFYIFRAQKFEGFFHQRKMVLL